jgi:hypothetical protein
MFKICSSNSIPLLERLSNRKADKLLKLLHEHIKQGQIKTKLTCVYL